MTAANTAMITVGGCDIALRMMALNFVAALTKICFHVKNLFVCQKFVCMPKISFQKFVCMPIEMGKLGS